MDYIINKQSPGGTKQQSPTITFDNDLVLFGTDPERVDIEIRRDFLRELVTINKSVNFNRGAGIGIDLYENETVSELTRLKLILDIMAAVERYNGRVPGEKQIIVSQEMITIKDDGKGAMLVNIYYIQNIDMMAGTPLSNVQNVTIPLGV